MNGKEMPLVDVRNLSMHFRVGHRPYLIAGPKPRLRAVDGVSLSIYRGEIVGLVGESGCGKSTLGQAILQLYRPTGGDVFYDGVNLVELNSSRLRPIRRRMQIVFQDPFASLDPRMTVGRAVGEPLAIQGTAGGRKEIRERTDEALRTVGLLPGLRNRYPHEFSAGQRQRIAVARAIIGRPEFLVLDEPISSMDVSIQAQIINLLLELQESLGLTFLFISHDLRVVHHISDRVLVMYLGKIVELAGHAELYENPLHPYTEALFSAAPRLDTDKARISERIRLKGELPSPLRRPPGCAFEPRCPRRMDICRTVEPPLLAYDEGHLAACHAVESEIGPGRAVSSTAGVET